MNHGNSMQKKCMNEKDTLIQEFKEELAACKNRDACGEEKEIQSAVVRELENVKEQVKNLWDREEEK